ncbi:hypothetical protein [Clostridium sp. YIM B02551]|uniref:hypothetical protein n=1 Tax=Clostridium sp. YIM B02551 TaxID=2910679 RepID=UPI001EE9FF4D|nr:hypothetical protein [Clostridium sp. YIM B02551]
MDDDFDYEKEYQPIISDIDRIEEFLENQKKEKQTLKYNKIYNFIMSFLWIFSMVIAYLYIIILKKYYNFEAYAEPPYFNGPPIGNSSLFETYKKYFQPYFGILQYAAFSIKRIIPSKVISVTLSACVGFILILPAKIVLTNWLQHFYDVPSLYWLFIIYCISIMLYFLFGIFTLFNKRMYSYMENVSFINWLLPCLSNQLDNKGNRKITNSTYVIVLVPFLVLFLLSNFL